MRFTMRSRLSRSLGIVIRYSSLALMALVRDRGQRPTTKRPTTPLTFPHCSSFNPALVPPALENPFHVNAGSMHHVGIEFSDLDQVLDFSNRDFRSSCHQGIEISCCLAIDQISPSITLPGFH